MGAAGQAAPSRGGSNWGDVLGNIGIALMMADPLGRNNQMAAMMMRNNEKRRDRNETQEWLLGQGVDQGTAKYLSRDTDALRSWYEGYRNSKTPDWEIGTIYDDQGREQRIMYDSRNPSQYSPLGGAKSNVMSPAEEAQKIRLAQAGRAETNVNVGAEKGYDKTLGEGYGKTFLGIQDAGRTARSALGTLDVMENAMSQPGFYSGAGGDRSLQLRRWGAALGITDPEGIRDIESFNAMSKQAALDSMGGSLGTGFSNADRDFVIDQVPNLGNTPEGNAQLIDIQRKINQRRIEIAGKAREYAQRNGGRIDFGFDDELAQWADRNPLFPPRPSGGEGPERVYNPPAGAPRPRATNPSTGETVEFDGRQWVPVR
ncbi:hypothetical protein [Mesorhizobium sp. 1B3]|uniref:hypothetical protein n=1 Tax=Mesorhizobium sp. 1B3 TaxID=3243599 RepID=UPI003D992628